MKIILKTLFITLCFSAVACGQLGKEKNETVFINYEAIKTFPKPEGYINDFEDLFTPQQEQELYSIIEDFEQKTTNQIAIVTIETVDPYENLKDFTTDLGNFWDIGLPEKDNGLIITISNSMRSIWIGTGTGTEKILTDEILDDIIATQIIPEIKKDNIFEGIKSGLLACIKRWK